MDLVLNRNDLSVSPSGDLVVTSNDEAISLNLYRLLNSAYNVYTKLVRTNNSLSTININYKSDILYYLSSSADDLVNIAEEIIGENIKVLPSINITTIEVERAQLDRVNINVQYTVNNGEVETVTINGN